MVNLIEVDGCVMIVLLRLGAVHRNMKGDVMSLLQNARSSTTTKILDLHFDKGSLRIYSQVEERR